MATMKNPFRGLGEALHGALRNDRMEEGAALVRVLSEALCEVGLKGLLPTLVSAHRADPAKGLRGSELVLVVSSHSAAARVRLAGPNLLAEAKTRGLGFQTIRVRAVKAVANRPPPSAPDRPAIPGEARARLLALIQAQDH